MDISERAKYLRDQRDKLMNMKQSEREKHLKVGIHISWFSLNTVTAKD